MVPLGTAGVVIGLAVGTAESIRQDWATDNRALFGYVLAYGAATSYGGTNVIAKELTQDYRSPLMISGLHCQREHRDGLDPCASPTIVA